MVGAALLVLNAIAQPGAQPFAVFDAGVFAASPIALGSGLLIGPSLGATWRPSAFGLGLCARFGSAEEGDLVWLVQHRELRVTARAEYGHRIGRGELSLAIGAGGFLLSEMRVRHQAERLAASGFTTETSASATGGIVLLEVAIRLHFIDKWAIGVEGGPEIALRADDSIRGVLGWTTGVSLVYLLGFGA
jgi:hypothetical protein